jgi:hypothetical protein
MNASTVMLILTLITPPHQPNVQRVMPEASIEKCWEDAKAFVEAGPGAADGVGEVQGIVAGCAVKVEAHT